MSEARWRLSRQAAGSAIQGIPIFSKAPIVIHHQALSHALARSAYGGCPAGPILLTWGAHWFATGNADRVYVLTEEVLRGLASYRKGHINRFGEYMLDLEREVTPMNYKVEFSK